MNIIKFFKWLLLDQFMLGFGGGGGGGGPMQTTSTSYQTNIPEYARPYVETMLGATQRQLFTMDGDQITGFRPYQPYSTDPTAYVAPFSPLQQQAQQATGALTVPGQYAPATGLALGAGLGSLGAAGQAMGAGEQYAQMATTPSSIQAYMSPYMQNVVDYQKTQALRDYAIGQPLRRAQAVGQGAFGGSRQAIMESEAQRNLMSQLQGITATGAQQAFQQAQQAQQFGSQLGLQGIQTGLGGLGQAAGAAGALGQLGGQQLAAQQGVIGTKASMGAQQQAQQQQIINQAIQDWANAQQYPLMQLGVMSNMLRGLPMQAATTQQYTASPNALTQGIGTIGALGSLGKALSTGKEGGLPSEFKKSGGIMSYDVGGEVESKLYDMDEEGLQKYIQTTTSDTARKIARRILREKTTPGMASGGIVAFQAGGSSRLPAFAQDTLTLPQGDLPVEREETKEQRIMREYRERQAAEAGRVTPYQQLKDYLGKSVDVSRQRALTAAGEPAPTPPAAPAAAPAVPPPAGATTVPGTSTVTNVPQTPPAAPSAAPTAPAPAGIKAAAPAAAPRAGEVTLEQILGTKPKERSMDEIMAEEKTLREKYVGPDTGRQEERARLMAERADAKKEAERQNYMRLAEFFAGWASTPGNTIVAGMQNLKARIPDILADRKEQKKYVNEINKSIANIDEAVRLEKVGDYDKARKIKEAEAKRTSDWYDKLMDVYRTQETVKGTIAAAGIRAEGAGGGAGSEKLLAKVEADISREKNGDTYKAAYKWANMTLPKDASQMMKDKVANAKAELQKFEADFERRRQRARTGEDTTPAAATASAPNVIRYNAQGERI